MIANTETKVESGSMIMSTDLAWPDPPQATRRHAYNCNTLIVNMGGFV
jgi:hypothetical protein